MNNTMNQWITDYIRYREDKPKKIGPIIYQRNTPCKKY